MYKKIYKLILASASFMGLSSCEDLLHIKETDFIAGETALRTVKNNESLIIGAYSLLGPEMSMRLNMVLSDEIKSGEFYASQSTHEWKFNYDDVSIRDNYTATTDHYRIIDRANRVIAALPNALDETPTDADLRKRVSGEALFLRAYTHFELFRYYAGNYDPSGLAMAYMEAPSLETHERINMGDYFQKLIRDLNEAKNLLPDNLSDKSRANKLAATGLQARVALYMRNWTDAITYSTEYINAIPLSPRDQFAGLWLDNNTNETAFRLPRTDRFGSFFRGLFTRNAQGVIQLPGNMSWFPSDKLWNSYDSTDIRFSTYLIDEPLFKAAGRPSKITKKYAGSAYTTDRENMADMKVFRTAEMYLIRAEARAESNALAESVADLNALRAARISPYTAVNIASKDQLITEIIQERFKELAFEGHRFWDLKRRGLPVQRLASDAPSNDGATLPANNFRFTLPIPQPEMLANPKMVQNPGYAN